ncbi:hypothetical protein [Chryseobacterium cheonjiense]|uniref:Uncharacterized protein n=1 Tax=Chryseobacterium cheonjiense TaxID=2728845 RepID=A0A7Y0A8Z0_9FLAO|nr:hypothetical protein [Chryseobacterium cheonjiense]NML58636.1 hypothetical protein [Chryseobacterium cheonjiense]
MDFNIVKIGGFIVLILSYVVLRKAFSKFADFTERIGKPYEQAEEMQEEINRLNTKIINLEQQINPRL